MGFNLLGFFRPSPGKDRANLYDSSFDVGRRASSTVDASAAAAAAQAGLNKSYSDVARAPESFSARASMSYGPARPEAPAPTASGPIETRRAPTQGGSSATSDPFALVASDGNTVLGGSSEVSLDPSKVNELPKKLEAAVRRHRETEAKLRVANARAKLHLDDANAARRRAETAEAQLSQTQLELARHQQALRTVERDLDTARRDLEIAQSTPSGMTMVQKLSEGDLISAINLQQKNLLAAADTLFDDLDREMSDFMAKSICRPLITNLPFLNALSHVASALHVQVETYLAAALNQITLRLLCEGVWEDFVPGLSSKEKYVDESLKAVYGTFRSELRDQWVQVSIWRQFTVRQLFAQLGRVQDSPPPGAIREAAVAITKGALHSVLHLLDAIGIATDEGPQTRSARSAPATSLRRFESALVKILSELIDLKVRAQTEAGIVDIELSFSPPPMPTGPLQLDTPVCVQSVERRSRTFASHGQEGTSNHQPTQYGLAGNIFGEDAFSRVGKVS